MRGRSAARRAPAMRRIDEGGGSGPAETAPSGLRETYGAAGYGVSVTVTVTSDVAVPQSASGPS